MEHTEPTVSFDDMLDALAHARRRKLLIALLERDPRGGSPDVIADPESDAGSLDRLLSMKHVHLPKLVDYGFIEWTEATHEVSRGPTFDEIRPLLELLDAHEDELPADWLSDHCR